VPSLSDGIALERRAAEQWNVDVLRGDTSRLGDVKNNWSEANALRDQADDELHASGTICS
jgi:hypothetical protein